MVGGLEREIEKGQSGEQRDDRSFFEQNRGSYPKVIEEPGQASGRNEKRGIEPGNGFEGIPVGDVDENDPEKKANSETGEIIEKRKKRFLES